MLRLRSGYVFLILLVLLTIKVESSRFIKGNSNLISDGGDQLPSQYSSVLELGNIKATTVTCEPIYGVLPCSATVWGQLFMVIVYEILLSFSGKYISSGSNLFFEMFGTGIFGASLFNMLGMLPRLILVLVSAFSATEETTEALASMGLAMLAGSAIMSLTVIWGSVVAFGSDDLSESISASSNSETNEPFSLSGYGVRTDDETRYTGRIMLLSMIPILILLLAKILNSSSATRILILISLIISVIFLIAYCTYQVFEPWIQNRRLEYLMTKYVQKYLLRSLLTANGRPNVAMIRGLFHRIDKNNDTYISTPELRALILGIQIEEVGLNEDDFVAKLMEEFDITGDSHITEMEFVNVLTKWLNNAKQSDKHQGHAKPTLLPDNSKGTTEEKQSLVPKKRRRKGTRGSDQPAWWNYTKAAFLVILGIAITFLLGRPLMITLREFSASVNIPSFLVSYVVIPLALGYRQVLRTVKSARQKTEKAASLTFSEIYGAVFMNNVMGLATFLALVYIRDLSLDFSAEILTVLIICTIMGLSASFGTKFPFWTSILAYLLYPISLLLLYVLTLLLESS